MPVIVKPVSRRSSLTSAVVSTRFGCRPAFSRLSVSAIEKQPASAAPMSSSGLLPSWPSKRVPAENVASGACPPFIVPLPALNPPCHEALALLMPMIRLLFPSLASVLPGSFRETPPKHGPAPVQQAGNKSTPVGAKPPPRRTFLGEYFAHARPPHPPRGSGQPRLRPRRRLVHGAGRQQEEEARPQDAPPRVQARESHRDRRGGEGHRGSRRGGRRGRRRRIRRGRREAGRRQGQGQAKGRR